MSEWVSGLDSDWFSTQTLLLLSQAHDPVPFNRISCEMVTSRTQLVHFFTAPVPTVMTQVAGIKLKMSSITSEMCLWTNVTGELSFQLRSVK